LNKKIRIISSLLESKSRVLVLGCGNGQIIKDLKELKDIKGFGLDIDEKKVFEAISNGVSVIQGDINSDLLDYPEASFDYVIAHDVLQITKRPDKTLEQMLAIGKKAIVSFPNFAYFKIRLHIFFRGEMPKSGILPYEWYETPNIHLFTSNDFKSLCSKKNVKILKEIHSGIGKKDIPAFLCPNLFAEFSYFLLVR
jgi:methionine biosynthesis protein MetW